MGDNDRAYDYTTAEYHDAYNHFYGAVLDLTIKLHRGDDIDDILAADLRGGLQFLHPVEPTVALDAADRAIAYVDAARVAAAQFVSALNAKLDAIRASLLVARDEVMPDPGFVVDGVPTMEEPS